MSTIQYYIGVMSGSSLDGIDVVLTDLTYTHCKVVATHFQAYPESTKKTILKLHFAAENELVISALLENELACLYAEAIHALLKKTAIASNQIIAIGCHGQTIRHQPTYNNAIGYTIQLGNNALLAELTNISVVSDFRKRDIAAGGQGAPLVPAFHQAVFASKTKNRAIINIGGIANISYLDKDGGVLGFDTGPGNILLDYWVKKHQNKAYDQNGEWASTGSVLNDLLTTLLSEPYFTLLPPKSTGRDLFNKHWLEQCMQTKQYLPEDVARTLVELTSESIYQALKQYCPNVEEVYLCGGGAHNSLLKDSLALKLTSTLLSTTDTLDVNVDWVEATAFAWLAKQTIEKKYSNLPSVTGASGLRILGAVYPA